MSRASRSRSSGAESVQVSASGGARRRAGGGDGGDGDDESGRSEPGTSLMPGSAPPPPHQSEQSQWYPPTRCGSPAPTPVGTAAPGRRAPGDLVRDLVLLPFRSATQKYQF